MNLIKSLTAVIISLFLLNATSIAQDSLAVHQWEVSSQKIGEGRYELNFSAKINNSWFVYAPNRVYFDLPTTELKFADSAIRQEGAFVLSQEPVKTKSEALDGMEVEAFQKQISFKVIIQISGDIPSKLPGNLLYTYGRGMEYYPSTDLGFVVDLEGGVGAEIPVVNMKNPVNDCGDDSTRGKSLITIFLLGLLYGLIALLTPCVFPMIPVTVTFFTKKSGDRRTGIRNAAMYGFFIFLIYVLITVPFHVASKSISPAIFNNISTSATLNLIFFAIFVFFALSFFGLFELSLPSGIANRMDAKSSLGNIGGIFFMAATLTIVSFSCTGPLLGTLLVDVVDQGAWPLTVGAAGFGIALGLPFALFAMFPNWLQSLPKSGGWMTDVKVVLGFLELALAIKFFSNADLVKQWGLLKRELFIGLWVLLGLLIVLYLTGVLRVKNSSRIKKFSFVRISFILVFAAITGYLAMGLTNLKWSNLRLISGFPPPRSYSYFPPDRTTSIFQPLHNDYKGALAKAKAENKPLLIDFTGWACVNCRRMEDKVWLDKTVDSLFRNEFVVVSLYVDEKNNLPLAEQTVVKLNSGAERSVISIGDKWTTFQTENFGATSQPQYAILSPEGRALTKTKFYTPNADEFIEWLECGLDAFRKTR